MGTTSPLYTIVQNASSTFVNTTGFEFGSVIDWAGEKVLLLLGGGLGLVDATIGWIMAVIIVSIILGLVYKGLRFFGILR